MLSTARTLAWISPLALLPLHGVSLETEYKEGLAITHEKNRDLTMALGEFEVLVNGEELPEEIRVQAFGEMSFDAETKYHTITNTKLVELESGEPSRVLVEWEVDTKTENSEASSTGLEGRKVSFSLVDGEVTSEIADDGEKLDPSLIALASLRNPYDALLPEEPVEKGDSWKVDAQEMISILEMDDVLEVGDEPEEDSEKTDALKTAIFDAFDEPCIVTFEGLRTVDERSCAVLNYVLTFAGDHPDANLFLGLEDEGLEGTLEFDTTVKGTVLFDVELAFMSEATQEIELQFNFDVFGEQQVEDFTLRMDMTIEMIAKSSATETWSVREPSDDE